MFQSANEYDDSVNNIYAKCIYPATQVRTTEFTGHLRVNIRGQKADV
jgi:hypothetical protein